MFRVGAEGQMERATAAEEGPRAGQGMAGQGRARIRSE